MSTITVDCEYWATSTIIGGGICNLNLYGGKPSAGICSRCGERKPNGNLNYVPYKIIHLGEPRKSSCCD